MKVIILAGGSGTRLWPLSRKDFPKQFLKLFGNKSLLQLTAERFLNIVKPEDIIVITNKNYDFLVRSDLPWLEHIIIEPVGRNTAPAIALALRYCTEKLSCPIDEVMFISPSDHIIEPIEKFAEYIRLSENAAQEGWMITFGIKPTKPETGYGYIKAGSEGSGEQGSGSVLKVENFVEKPDLETAEKYLEEGRYYWNSGMFVFSAAAMAGELKVYAPDIWKMLDLSFDEMIQVFPQMPNISIDYAVMERSQNTVVIPADLRWNDIGSWDSLFELPEIANSKRAASENLASVDTKNTLIFGDKRLIAVVGCDDSIIVDTEDALLVVKRGHAQKVKGVVEALTAKKKKEVSEHTTTSRPWGSFTNLAVGNGYKVKRIVVNPGGKLSLQLHKHRSEHWIVVQGKAKITVDDKDTFINENETAYIPKFSKHRVENCEEIPLEMIEVQYGTYTGEDDIVRLEDIYGRA